ncbi:DUF2267 domain-containing protein [Halalkalicoccus tibetensis]|uniref:DUF2267 domain-containing protein n=1 Tax=Halalkalicoccus tibetensis TaxID=175632 RepID=A0ABD5VAD8_9EURY
MQENAFLDAVERHADLESRDQAYTVTSATLTVLGQRITEGEAENVASQLPAHLDDLLMSKSAEAEEFSADRFVSRIDDREDVLSDVDADAEHHARAVLTVLGDAVSGSELEDAREQLPDEFDPLFEPVDLSEQQY